MKAVCDRFWGGQLRVWQPARAAGYRFNLDSVLLASFCRRARHVIDLGSGCGIVALLLLACGRAERATAVEVQPDLAELCWRNARDNGLAQRLQVHCADVRDVKVAPADLVAFNPPYFPARAGPPSPIACRDQARNERHGTLADFVACAARHMDAGAELCAIVRPSRADEAQAHGAAHALRMSRQRQVQARDAATPRHTLLALQAAAALPTLLPPLIVHGAPPQRFSAEVAALVAGAAGWHAGPIA